MKLQIKELYNGNKQSFSNVELSLCETSTKGFYRVELHNEGKKQYVEIKDIDGKLVNYSKNFDELIAKSIIADKLMNWLKLKTLSQAIRRVKGKDYNDCYDRIYSIFKNHIEHGDTEFLNEDLFDILNL